MARHKFEAHRGKCVLHFRTFGEREVPRLRLVVVVLQPRERPGLGDAVGVKRLSRFLQNVDEFCGREAIADAEICESLDFRKGAQDDDFAAFAHVFDHVGRVRQKLVIRFVKHHDDVFGHLGHERIELLL